LFNKLVEFIFVHRIRLRGRFLWVH